MSTRIEKEWGVRPEEDETDQLGAGDSEVAAAAERVRTALDLFAMGMEMLRTRLKREEPGLSDEEVEQRVDRWLLTRRGAEAGDGQGRPVPWPRKRR
jgi:hypothetical protein